VRAVLSDLRVNDGLEIHHDADLPARSGLGSSSSFTVGLLNALHALDSKMISKRDLACEAIRIEQEVLKEQVGSQDQMWAGLWRLQSFRVLSRRNFRHIANDLIYGAAPRAQSLPDAVLYRFLALLRPDFAQDQVKNIPHRKKSINVNPRDGGQCRRHPTGREGAVARTGRTLTRVLAAQTRAGRQAFPIGRSTRSTMPRAMLAPLAANYWGPAEADLSFFTQRMPHAKKCGSGLRI